MSKVKAIKFKKGKSRKKTEHQQSIISDRAFVVTMAMFVVGGFYFQEIRGHLSTITHTEAAAASPAPVKAVESKAPMLRRGEREYFESYSFKEWPEMRTTRMRFTALFHAAKKQKEKYCVPFDGAPDEKIVGTFHIRGFCQFRPTFFELCAASGSDKVGAAHRISTTLQPDHGSHNYEAFYPLHLEHLRYTKKQVRMLEMGTYLGKSSFFWKRYFGDDLIYVGVDAHHPLWYQWHDFMGKREDEEPGKRQFDEYDTKFGFTFVLGPQQDQRVMASAIKAANGSFDIIIDDGSHHNDINRKCFEHLFENGLASGGTYFIEDLNTAYSGRQNGGFGQETSWIEYTKKMLDTMNRQNFDHTYR